MTTRKTQLRALFLTTLMVVSVLGFAALPSDFGGPVEKAAASHGAPGANEGHLDGDGNSEIDTAWRVSGNQTPYANVTAGSGGQSLGLLLIRDVSGGNAALGDKTVITLPQGMTVSESISASDLTVTVNENDSDGSTNLDVDSKSISSDRRKVTIHHTTSSDDNETLRIGGLVVNTTASFGAQLNGGQPHAINIKYALDASAGFDATLIRGFKPALRDSDGVADEVGAGSNGVLVFNRTLNISFNRTGGQIASGTDIHLYSNTSNGITWDTTVDGQTIINQTQTSRISIDSENISIASDVITIPVNGSSHPNGGNVSFQLLRVNVSGTASDGEITADVRGNESTGTVSVENPSDAPTIDVKKPSVYLDPPGVGIMGWNSSAKNDRNVSVGRSQQDLGWNISVNATTDSDIQAGDNITLSFNNSAVTFDKSATDRGLVDVTVFNKTAGQTGDAGDGVDAPEISSDGTSLTVNVTGDGLEARDNVSFSGVRLNITSAPANATGVGINLTTGSNQNVVNQSKHKLVAIRPNVTFNGGSNYTLRIGDTGNRTGDVNAGQIDLWWSEDDPQALPTQTTNITISLESGTGVTFNQSLNASRVSGGVTPNTPKLNATNRSDPGDTGQIISDKDNTNVSATVVNSKTIALVLHNGSRWISDTSVQAFNISNVWLNATGDAQNTSVTFSVNTTGVEDTAGEITVASSKPTTAHFNNSANLTVTLDDDPPGQPAVVNQTVNDGEMGDLNVSFGVPDDIPSQGFNITLSIPSGNGITVQDQPLGSFTNISGATSTANVADETTINITVSKPDPRTSSEHATVNVSSQGGIAGSGIQLNVTEDAVNTTLTFSLNRSPSGTTEKISDKPVQGLIVMNRVEPNEIDFNGNSQGGFGDNTNTTTVDEQPEHFLIVNHSNQQNFSGADVSVSIEDNDNGAEIISGSSVTTFQNGTAKFRTDPGTATNVTYNITATLDSDPTVNQTMTLTVQPGAPTQITAEHHKNAVEFNTTTSAEPNQEIERAAIKVTLRDQFDNLVTNTDVTVDNIALNRSGTVVGGANNTTAVRLNKGMMAFNGSSGQVNTTSDGAFYIVIGAGEGTKTFSVTVDISSPVTDSVDATTTVYSQVDQTSIGMANRSTPLIRDTNMEVPVTLLDENGNAIQVANQTVRKTSSNSTVLSQRGQSQVTTNASGMTTAQYHVDQDGSANVRATAVRDNVLGSKQFTAVDPTLEITSVSPSSIEALNETDVNVTVAYEHNGSVVENVDVALEGAGVNTSGTTDENGLVTLANVNATDASADIEVSATKTVRQGVNDATNATITVTQKTLTEVALNITANRTEIVTDETVLFTVTRDDTDAVVDATVTIDGTDYSSGSDGTVNVTFTSAGTVTATASKANTTEETFTNDSVDVSVYVATVTFDDVTVENGTMSVTVDSAEYTGGAYFVAIHNASAGSPGPIIGTSSEQSSGANSDITVDLDEALVNNVTLTAMLHESDAGSRGAAITRNGAAVTDSASVTVTEEALPTAVVQIDDQTFQSSTDSLTVANATYTGGDFAVAIHNTSAGSPGPIIGWSNETQGVNTGVTVDLDESITRNVTVTAMLHESFQGAAITRGGSAVTDTASITIEPGDDDNIPSKYEDDNNQVQTDGLRTAINDWATGAIDTSLLRDIINEWATGG